jgi:acetyl-CoA C-acetyltransferase
VTTGGVTVNRFCSSGMQAIAMAAQRVIVDRVPIMAAGGLESISLVQNEHFNNFRIHEPWLDEHKPEVYMPMIETAEVVANRYYITREVQDAYALSSQQRTAAGQKAGRFEAEIVPLKTKKMVQDKTTGETREEEVTLKQDEGNRPDTTLAGLAALKPVMGEKGFITAGNASQLSDGASACIVMDAKLAEKRNLKPLGIFRGYTVAACEPDEMGIGPVFAVPRLLERAGVKLADVGLFELNEAFAVQVLAFLDHFGIADDDPRVNRYGGAIATGHPLASSGIRLMTQLARQFEDNPDVRYGLTAMCIGIGMGGAVIWENPHHGEYGKELEAPTLDTTQEATAG